MATSLTSVKGIGLATAKYLTEHGIESGEQLAAMSVEQLMEIPGFGPVRAKKVIEAAQALKEIQDAVEQIVERVTPEEDVKQDKPEKAEKKVKLKKKKKEKKQAKEPKSQKKKQKKTKKTKEKAGKKKEKKKKKSTKK